MKKKSKKVNYARLKSLVLLVMFTIVLAVVEIYAWMSTQTNVSINNLTGRVEVVDGLKISFDAETWTQKLELANSITTEGTGILAKILEIDSYWDEYDAGIGNILINNNTNAVASKNIRPKKVANGITNTGYLLPLSSSGTKSSTNDTMQLFSGVTEGVKLSDITTIDENSESAYEDGYYAFDLYLMNTDDNSSASLDTILQLNYNSVVQEIGGSDNIDYGLKNCVRVAFALYEKTADINAESKEAVVEEIYGSDIKQIAIWEPNSDTHSSYVMGQNKKLNELVSSTTTSNILNTYSIKSNPLTNEIANVYNTGDTSLTSQVTMQTSGNLVIHNLNGNEVASNGTGTLDMIDVENNKVRIEKNKISKLRVYIWLEGQDADCVNWASHSEGIDINISLAKGFAEKENLENIEEEITDKDKRITKYLRITAEANNKTLKMNAASSGIFTKLGANSNGISTLGEFLNGVIIEEDWNAISIEANGEETVYTKEEVESDSTSDAGNIAINAKAGANSEISMENATGISIIYEDETLDYDIFQVGNVYIGDNNKQAINVNDVITLRNAIIGNEKTLNSEYYIAENANTNLAESEGTLPNVGDVMQIRQKILSGIWK